ncbi:helix-turn-helix domain-containing protein [Microbispora sp. H10670]|uniref:helix-turn-helix domain-containing protein n=1 Tax=Microbispora sp. H10670 TaxID=2729108 RepID=UPI0015FFA1F7|nr:helix-turn-helix domain-containing protein [Microbispora sp. H10670]
MLISTERLPEADRFDFLRERALALPEPVEFVNEMPAEPFEACLRFQNLGALTVGSFTSAGPVAVGIRRTPRLVRTADPEMVRLLVNVHGLTGVAQSDSGEVLFAGEVGLHDTSRPYYGWHRADGSRRARLFMLSFHRQAFPALPASTFDRLTGTKLGASAAMRRLAATLADRVLTDADHYMASDPSRVASILAGVVEGLFGHVLDQRDPPATAVGDRVLLHRVQAFIEQRLDDRTLSPALIAAAFHISPRTLQRLFASQERGQGVAAWIRRLRLGRCRRDLGDPHLADRPAHAVGLRWGFADPAHFTRAFRAAYGVTPAAYRRGKQIGSGANGSGSGPAVPSWLSTSDTEV